MNDPSVLNNQQLSRDASLNTLMYLGEYYEGVSDGTSVKSIVNQANVNLQAKINSYIDEGHTVEEANAKYGDDLRKVTILKNSINNDPGLGKLVIANQSSGMNDPSTGHPYESGGLSVCTFQDSLNNPNNVTVVYRGTGAGEWYDNGLGLSGEITSTEQQSQATEYFDYIVKKNGWNNTTPKIYITGHSKGGNKTQYVVMTSMYSDLIVNGYSLDGQCMSKEAIDYFIEKYGIDEYNKRRQKLYSISADNDYVNVLGINNQNGRLIPDENIFFLESNLSGVAWHYPDCYMNADGSLTAFTEQGEISKLLQGISEQTMDLPVPIRSIITNGAMGIAQMTLGKNKNPVNGESFSYADIIASVPLLLETIPGGTIQYLGDKFGVDLDWLANTVTAFNLLYFAPLNILAYGFGSAIDIVLIAKEKIIEFGKKCVELTEKVVAFIDNGVKNLQNWYNKNFNIGYKYASSNPQIKLDTYKLNAYAQRLRSVNTRISNLDSRLDSLYWKVGLLDLWNLMQADILTGYSWRLNRCISYLSETSTDFSSVENELINNI